MSTSRQIAILSEIASGHPSVGTQAYLQTRAMHAFYDFVVGKFLEKEKAGELTRAELARRARKQPAVITRLLSGPSNMTIATLSDLLFAISKEEPVLSSAPILGRAPLPNWSGIEVAADPNSRVSQPAPMQKAPVVPKRRIDIMDVAYKLDDNHAPA